MLCFFPTLGELFCFILFYSEVICFHYCTTCLQPSHFFNSWHVFFILCVPVRSWTETNHFFCRVRKSSRKYVIYYILGNGVDDTVINPLRKLRLISQVPFCQRQCNFFLKGLQPSSESLCCFFVHRETNYFTKLFTIWRSELTAPWRCDIFIGPLHKQVIVLDNKKPCQPSSGQRAEARFDFEEYVGILRGIWSILLSDNSLIIERHG